jgi:amino acid transporter
MKKLVVFLLLILVAGSSMTQCAMCRQTAEQASEGNTGIAEGLNSGIVYLMILPYLLFLIGGLVFFRKKIASFFKN